MRTGPAGVTPLGPEHQTTHRPGRPEAVVGAASSGPAASPSPVPRPAAPWRSPCPGLRPKAAMQDPFDPALITPEERDREVAAILATGYLRLRRSGTPSTPPLPPCSPENSLEQPGDHAPPCPAGERPKRGRTRKEVRK